MLEKEWVIKTLFVNGPGRRGIIALSLASWLLIVAVVAKVFFGCSANLLQAAVPPGTQIFKIAESSLDIDGPFVKIRLPSCLDGELTFLEKDIFAAESKQDVRASICDVSALANIGLVTELPRVQDAVPLNRSTLLNPVIMRAASQYQVDPALVRAIIFAESGYNPTAVSKSGAMGLMQLMPGTAKAMGVEDCFDPEHNIYGGVKYFKKLFVQFDGDVRLALAAYNAGSRKVRQFNGVPPFRATEYYIQKVLKYYKIYQGQQAEPVGLS